MDIMIVEDDELMAMDMERMIESMGHEVRGMATSSDEALALLEDRYVDLAILDIRIQGQYDGIELAEQISRLDEGILILFVTSMQDDLTFNRASRSQPAGFVVKPFTEIQFRRTVELILKQKEQQTTGLESRHPESDVEFNPQALFIRKRNEIKKIFFRDIQYLEADGGKYSKIYLGDDVFVVDGTGTEHHFQVTGSEAYLYGAAPIRQPGEPDDVDEQHRNIAGLNLLERIIVLGQLRHHIG